VIIYVKRRKSSLEEIAQQLRVNQAQGGRTAFDGDIGQKMKL
jgi:hypothetical protein